MEERLATSNMMLEGLRGLFSSIEKILSAAIGTKDRVDLSLGLKMFEPSVGAAPVEAEEEEEGQEEEVAEPGAKVEKVLLGDGSTIDAEIQSEGTKTGRTTYYIVVNRRKIILSRKKNQWHERKKAVRSFDTYQLKGDDELLIRKVGELNAQGIQATFMDLKTHLNKSQGEILGRYRSVHGAGYVEKIDGRVILTEKGRQFLGSNPSVEEAVQPEADAELKLVDSKAAVKKPSKGNAKKK